MSALDSRYLASEPTGGLGLYFHIPFCPQRCPYCGFAVVTGNQDVRQRYTEAVCTEIGDRRAVSDRKTVADRRAVDTIFFGGGTPSRLDARHLDRIMSAVEKRFVVDPGAEIAIEVNPGAADRGKFGDFRQLGFNRISIGAQSFCDSSLKRLGRRHTADDALAAFASARECGFDNVSLDLIFSIPNVSAENWRRSLETAVALHPEHVSIYGLTIEEGTAFHSGVSEGRMETLSDEEDGRQYEAGIQALTAAGYEHYEVSNFAMPACRSRHNWRYWTGDEYLGLGMSAHSYIGDCRSWNTVDLIDYMQRVESGRSPSDGAEHVDVNTRRRERIWLGLRTCEGLELDPAEELALLQRARFHSLVKDSFISLDARRLKLAERGFLVADALGTEVIAMLEPLWTEGEASSRHSTGVLC